MCMSPFPCPLVPRSLAAASRRVFSFARRGRLLLILSAARPRVLYTFSFPPLRRAPLVLSAARPRASHFFAPSLRQGAACILFAARARASGVDCARRACFVVDAGFLAAAGGAAAAQGAQSGGCGSRVTGRYACSEKYDFLIHHAAMPRAIDKGTSTSDICKLYIE